MRYFFVLGRLAALSIAEIFAVLHGDFVVEAVSDEVMVISTKTPLDLPGLMRQLGGTIKIGEIVGDDAPLEVDALATTIAASVLAAKHSEGKMTFAVSAHGDWPALDRIGLTAKKLMTQQGVSVRFVGPSSEKTVSSVAIEKNGVIESGGEFVLMTAEKKRFIGKTSVVQPFEEFSQADYGRPGRDTIQGMLPPKLARSLVNFAEAKKDTLLLDPFCGSGTVLTEALHLGFTSVAGSDSNPVAIANTEKNLAWLKEQKFLPPDAAITLHVADARNIGQHLKTKSVPTVVTEVFLGPPRRGREQRGDLQRTLFQLSKLYYQCFSAWQQVLTADATLVVAFPLYILGNEQHGTGIKDILALGYEIVPLVSPDIVRRAKLEVTKNGGLTYGRSGQLVYREIVKFRRKK